jgi:hypothetical protein
MIAANELRIGNWIIRKSSGNHQQVREILTTRVLLDNEPPLNPRKHMTVSLLSIDPIHLSPEILEKCGGIKQPDNNGTDLYWFKKDFGIRLLNYTDPIVHILGYDRRHQNIKYIHQLQNLYFAIVGEELQVNL